MIRRPPRSTLDRSSAASDVYKRQYNSTPLLIVNSTDIDFVNNDDDFDELFRQIFREDRGVIEYFKPESKNVG